MIFKKIKPLIDNSKAILFYSFIPHQKIMFSWQYDFVLGDILSKRTFLFG